MNASLIFIAISTEALFWQNIVGHVLEMKFFLIFAYILFKFVWFWKWNDAIIKTCFNFSFDSVHKIDQIFFIRSMKNPLRGSSESNLSEKACFPREGKKHFSRVFQVFINWNKTKNQLSEKQTFRNKSYNLVQKCGPFSFLFFNICICITCRIDSENEPVL